MGNQISPFIVFTFLLTILLFVSCGDRASDSHNFPPAIPSNPSPADGAIDQVLDVQLSWECSDPQNDTLLFYIYLGVNPDPPLIDSIWAEKSYHPEGLQNSQTYFWKITARDDHQNRTIGPVWRFTTLEESGLYMIGSIEIPAYVNNLYFSDGYLYLTCDDYYVRIVDCTIPSDPILVTEWDALDMPEDLFVAGSYLFVTCGDAGLRILAIHDPANPYPAGRYDPEGWTGSVFVTEDYAFLIQESGFLIVDISDPYEPVLFSAYEERYDCYKIFVAGGYAYVIESGCYSGRFSIADISDPGEPAYVGVYSPIGYVGDIFVSGSYAYITAGGAPDYNLMIIDISNPSDPTPVHSFETHSSLSRVFVSDNHCFVTKGLYGLQILNVSNPRAPVVIRNFDTENYASSVFVEGYYLFVEDYRSSDDEATIMILKFIPETGIITGNPPRGE